MKYDNTNTNGKPKKKKELATTNFKKVNKLAYSTAERLGDVFRLSRNKGFKRWYRY